MRMSLLFTLLVLFATACSQPESTVQANLLVDFDSWSLEPDELRSVDVHFPGGPKYFRNLRDELVEIRVTLPCSDDLLNGVSVHSETSNKIGRASLDGFACTEEPQTVSNWDYVGPKIGGMCVNPNNWLGDCPH
jgi:hypothetical protein